MAVDLYRAQRVTGYVDLDHLLGASDFLPTQRAPESGPFRRKFSIERFEAIERWINAHSAKVRRDRQAWRPTGPAQGSRP
ncbi:hypothetical protein [Pengzhenrongella sp.]|jgi:hypothetical protein|uniref:hypothetical protein n=1 Tax=Pengzhenrongella sp. TaxID=2888820 RepID=UPI002F955CCB